MLVKTLRVTLIDEQTKVLRPTAICDCRGSPSGCHLLAIWLASGWRLTTV